MWMAFSIMTHTNASWGSDWCIVPENFKIGFFQGSILNSAALYFGLKAALQAALNHCELLPKLVVPVEDGSLIALLLKNSVNTDIQLGN